MVDPAALEGVAREASKGRASAVRCDDAGQVSLVLDVTGLEPPAREVHEAAVRGALMRLEGVASVRIAMTAERRRRRLIAVGSGKGGVGKSTFAANLAIAMKLRGRATGLVDADIYGPSQPRLLASEGQRPEARGEKLVPVPNRFGVPMLSMGHIVPPGKAIAWRGPMTGKALEQLVDADWGAVTDIVVDMPPGTGDIQLSMIQRHKPEGAIIVSTPQDLALMDAMRAIDLFATGEVPIIGVAENMAGYACPHCGEVSDPFGIGGAEAAARAMGHPFLGRVPLDAAIRRASDAGAPPAASGGEAAAPFLAIADRVIAWLDAAPAERAG